MNFYEKLKHAAQLNRSLVCVGLDPDLKKLPACLAGKKNPIFEFNKAIIDATRGATSGRPRRCTPARRSSSTMPTR